MTRLLTRRGTTAVALSLGLGLAVLPALAASAATTIDGPVNLGTATSFGVLGASTVTNTGPSTITGDLGVSPGTSITGFPPGLVLGSTNPTNALAVQAQSDLTTAYNVAASLSPTSSGFTELAGLSLTPGVYSGEALSLTGDLTLAGTAESVWVFQASSTLVTGSASRILLTGGASSCNVFWQVSSSATLGTASEFVGTIMANQSITATTAATVEGRLLASVGAVTLDSNVITQPAGCDDATDTVVTTSPSITSAAPTATAVAGTPYSSTVTASGSPVVTYTVTSGALPTGLTLNPTTGEITGTPTTPGTYVFTVTASNGALPDAAVEYTITVAPPTAPGVPPVVTVAAVGANAPELAATGTELLPMVALSGALLALGVALLVRSARSRYGR
jgi:hypothetical protein